MENVVMTNADQSVILRERLGDYEHNHFVKSLDRDLLVGTGATDDNTLKAIKALSEQMATIEAAHAEVARRLAALESEGD